ncbi:MAG: Bifunctional protein HldE [Candidatus Aminicenantes bacterium ADurb.Bin508]|nr:MAG: Bifunctional protein HldE [Candidatus Aminicenantes bacterium ADurb.Bin508]HPB55998.1 PfkB family carbohydrate kinase [Candidatus Aminicenantes bacterium]
MRARGESLLSLFETFRVGVVGDLLLDCYWKGSVKRISPEAPVPVFEKGEEFFRPGGGANVGENIRSLGGRVRLFGVVGEDEAGRRLASMVDSAGIVFEKGRATPLKTRILSGNQQLLRIDSEHNSSVEAASREAVVKRIREWDPQILLVSDYAKGMVTEELMDELRGLADQKGLPLVVDPKVSHRSLYKGVTGMVPNRKEAVELVGGEGETEELLERMIRLYALEWGLITLGERGMSGRAKGKRGFSFPAFTREVFDVTGAGDTVLAVIGLALGAGMELKEAAWTANVAASVVVGKLGASTLSGEELKKALQVARRVGP